MYEVNVQPNSWLLVNVVNSYNQLNQIWSLHSKVYAANSFNPIQIEIIGFCLQKLNKW